MTDPSKTTRMGQYCGWYPTTMHASPTPTIDTKMMKPAKHHGQASPMPTRAYQQTENPTTIPPRTRSPKQRRHLNAGLGKIVMMRGSGGRGGPNTNVLNDTEAPSRPQAPRMPRRHQREPKDSHVTPDEPSMAPPLCRLRPRRAVGRSPPVPLLQQPPFASITPQMGGGCTTARLAPSTAPPLRRQRPKRAVDAPPPVSFPQRPPFASTTPQTGSGSPTAPLAPSMSPRLG